jgi:hypothetical protein
MLRSWHYVLLMILLGVTLLSRSLAQNGSKIKYDPATETKISGTVDEVKEFRCPVSGTMGYHIALKTGDGVVMLHVASSKFMKDYEIGFEKGQHIDVVGSRVRLESGEDAVLAREIARGQSTYAFRDKQGNPLW